MKPVVLIILDGVGYNEKKAGNAVLAAHTPNLDYYRSNYPRSLLEASGEAVGLPEGFQGSSEVGHLSMGAGRVVIQELKRINDQLDDGSIYATHLWRKMMDQWKRNASTFHLFGLLQDEGVHAHYDHLFKFIRQATREYPEGKIVIHPFLDGRDTPPRSALEHLRKLRSVIDDYPNCSIGTLMGRYYGMDRAKQWELTDQAYASIVHGKGRPMETPEAAIEASYEKDRLSGGGEMFDEYIPPHVSIEYHGMQAGDVILHTNYRQDRATQLTKAFVEKDYPGDKSHRPDVLYTGLTQYYDGFTNFLLSETHDDKNESPLTVGEIISNEGLRQLRLAETQKFPHVTSFFNGKRTTPFDKEDRIEVPSRFDPSSFADHPEMEAYNVTDVLLKQLEKDTYAFIMVNYANGDMVGHTGDFSAGVRAMEILDKCLGIIIPRILKAGGRILLTADHGNVDQMIDYETGDVRTSHSLNPVELSFIADGLDPVTSLRNGVLSDIGVTILSLMGLPIPEEMTAINLIQNQR